MSGDATQIAHRRGRPADGRSRLSVGRYIALAALRQSNVRLFYALIMQNPEETLPMIYTRERTC